MESERFKYIFEKLHFNVKLWDNLTKDEIEDKLKSFVKEDEEEVTETDAFILMVISHGIDEKIMGSKACKALNVLDKDPTDAEAVIDVNTDVIDILKIVDIFSNINCRKLLNKPKLFFLNCCRISQSFSTYFTINS